MVEPRIIGCCEQAFILVLRCSANFELPFIAELDHPMILNFPMSEGCKLYRDYDKQRQHQS